MNDRSWISAYLIATIAMMLVGAVYLWTLYFRYEGPALNAFDSADRALHVRLSRDQVDKAVWHLEKREIKIAQLKMSSKIIGQYKFIVERSTDSRLVAGSSFEFLGGAGTDVNVLFCPSCAKDFASALPSSWSADN